MSAFKVICGVDFSGAKDAGNKIWIARGVPDGDKLLIQDCFRARDLPDSGRSLELCLPALVNLITSNRDAVFGFDFPFGLPSSLVHDENWEAFVQTFPARFESADNFKGSCFSEAGNRELRRRTDSDARTPFSPYNLRLYKQTYYGITKVLLPLVQDSNACVLPFQKPIAGKPWILEICPASTLKSLDLGGRPYKGSTQDRGNNRGQILEAIQGRGPIQFGQADIRQRIVADNGGDALDSVIAAMAIFKAFQERPSRPPADHDYLIEGYVYH